MILVLHLNQHQLNLMIVKIIFDDSEFPIFTPDFIKTFQVTLYQISSALLNYQLGEQMKINLEFYGSLKNIAKSPAPSTLADSSTSFGNVMKYWRII